MDVLLRRLKWISLLMMTFLLSGCMYPQERQQQLDKLGEQIATVQSAVLAYQREHRWLPYRYTEDEYKLTTKYKVNFQELQGGYLAAIPPSAFEEGGPFIYVLIDVEKKPTVRLFDLRVNDEVEKVQPYVTGYHSKYKKWPLGQKISPHFFTIDYEKLGISPVMVPSPYSSTTLPLIMDDQGKVYVDYRTDVMQKWQMSKNKPDANQDLRLWIAEDSFYVPAFSPVMKMRNNEPVFVRQSS
ncbi:MULTISPECIES: hypothetical protein [Thermoactinomyces]|uniref:Lipoprotein n=1 Tax=Thermoactinomyces daqus TaxID=1329516 RepID=A0A7W1XAR1_9BACL|nr:MULTISPECIES: hypothetical protein [Thermoactinomyces]MBA4543129.1 hypothetical protein [Thermoactinomyces daqus]MBH8603398.1 hypothetical protein [Thermoactinomyces sp. CICC 10522]MBH8607835.1 hypothetical protein [Thermoactinomyces sp. CICC 10521]